MAPWKAASGRPSRFSRPESACGPSTPPVRAATADTPPPRPPALPRWPSSAAVAGDRALLGRSKGGRGRFHQAVAGAFQEAEELGLAPQPLPALPPVLKALSLLGQTGLMILLQPLQARA